METHVVRQGGSSRELHGTPLAGVLLLPGMDTSVSRKVVTSDEGFSAGIASVGSLACVQPHVRFDMSARAERLRTFSTLEGLLVRVDSSMLGESFSQSEGRRAQFTSEGFLPAVNPLMSGQIAFASELLPASSTCECFLTRVEQHVTCEMIILQKFRRTKRA